MKYSFMVGIFSIWLMSIAFAQDSCFGPACSPTGPADLCFPQGCTTVSYQRVENFSIAIAVVPGTSVPSTGTCAGPAPCPEFTEGYKVMGWSGPCQSSDFSVCPDLLNQSYDNLRTNALRVNRSYKAAGLID